MRNHAAEPGTLDLLQRWYDFLAEHDELLLAPGPVDVTGAWVGAYDEALDVTFDEPVAGAVWRRVVEVDGRDTGPGTLRVRRAGAAVPVVRVADPDRGGALTRVPVTVDGDVATATLPAPHVWQLVVVDVDGDR